MLHYHSTGCYTGLYSHWEIYFYKQISENLWNVNYGNVDMRIRKSSCLKFTFLTGFAVLIVINIKSVGEDEQAVQVIKDAKKMNKSSEFSIY